jgi:predicted RND superfamily exporter protein
MQDPEISEIEGKLQETLGTRVHIEKKENGGYITIDFFTNDDLRTILDIIKSKNEGGNPHKMLENYIAQKESEVEEQGEVKLGENKNVDDLTMNNIEDNLHLMEDRTNEEIKKAEEEVDLYNIKNFSI